MKNPEIRIGTIAEVVSLSNQIPEFNIPYSIEDYEKRLNAKPHLILIAAINDKAIGFKVGYQDGEVFYSWMGGVIPGFREKGIAKMLANQQEKWARENGFQRIQFKTQNKFKEMLIFSIKNGFSIIDTIKYDGGEGFKILLEKKIYNSK